MPSPDSSPEVIACKPISSCASCQSAVTDVTLSCTHAMCSSCFTASLNIVGEKAFSCPQCSEPIQNFHFTNSTSSKPAIQSLKFSKSPVSRKAEKPSFDNSMSSLHAAFEEISLDAFAVLRLDDVPWVSCGYLHCFYALLLTHSV